MSMELGRARRLRMIEEIAHAMGSDTYSRIQSTLRVFDIEPMDPDDRWSGGFDGPEDYTRAHLHYLDGERLIELREYAVGEGGRQRTEWAPGLVRLFCSHLVTEKEAVMVLLRSLERYGMTGFVAHRDITPSVTWRESIEAHLDECDALLAFVHDGFYVSEWTTQEVGWALGRNRPVISLAYGEKLDLQGFMGARQAISVGEQPTDQLAKQIYGSLRKDERIGRTFGPALFRRLVDARSYYDTMTAARELVTRYPPLTADQARELAAAREQNDSVRDCVGGREDLESLLANAESDGSNFAEEPF